MNKCSGCRYLFHDHSVGYFECTKTEDFTDKEFDEYEQNGFLSECPYYQDEPDFDFS